MSNRNYSFLQLMQMDACTGCRACADVCPAVLASNDGKLSAVHRLAWQRSHFKTRGGLLGALFGKHQLSHEEWADFADTVFRCTLCGNCQEVCPVGIGLKGLWLCQRQELVERKAYPAKVDMILDNLNRSRNVFDEENEERAEWVEDLDDPPDHGYVKPNAEVVYFAGCVASFFPLAQKIPLALSEVLTAAEVDFAVMGKDEWCCGFPLLSAGMLPQAKQVIEHNVEAIKARGAKEVVFACPSCYMMFAEHYPREFRLSHTTGYLARLAGQSRLSFKPLNLTVTYHDPCDLGRGARQFEAPRQVIQGLPGVRLKEMRLNREHCLCCGGGGNLEMIDKDLSAAIAQRKMEMALETGAQAVVTSCQQCVRTMATYARRNKLDIEILDISQLVRRALGAMNSRG